MLITSLQNAHPLERIYSIKQFNESFVYGRTFYQSLDHIKFIDHNQNRQDHILKMVVSKINTTNWKELYGLDLNQTMNLEFSSFNVMAEAMAKHNATVTTTEAQIMAQKHLTQEKQTNG